MNELINQLVEIRKRLIYILIGFIIAFLCIFHFVNDIFSFVSLPLLHYLPSSTKLIATDVLSPFFVPLKLGAILAVLLSLPNTVYQVWCYVAPGLYKHERKLILPMSFAAIFLFILGLAFCYYLVLPMMFKFIAHIKANDIDMFTDISKYLDFILTLFLVFGLSFQLPIVIFVLLYLKLVEIKKLKSLRPYIIVLCFIVAAIVTPPDVFSQTILALSLYILYEFGMLFAYLL